jgi:hypothetical protein
MWGKWADSRRRESLGSRQEVKYACLWTAGSMKSMLLADWNCEWREAAVEVNYQSAESCRRPELLLQIHGSREIKLLLISIATCLDLVHTNLSDLGVTTAVENIHILILRIITPCTLFYWWIYCFFNNAVSCSGYIPLNEWWIMNRKGFGRKRWWSNRRTIQAFAKRDWVIPGTPWVRIANIHYLPKTRLQCCRYTNPIIRVAVGLLLSTMMMVAVCSFETLVPTITDQNWARSWAIF